MSKNTRQEMLKLAKQIANKIYSDRVERVKNLATLNYEEYIISASVVKLDEIDRILANHPEFDEKEFKKMIREAEAAIKANGY